MKKLFFGAALAVSLIGSASWIVMTPDLIAAHCDRAWLELERRPHVIDARAFEAGCNTLSLAAAKCVARGPVSECEEHRAAINAALPTLDWK